MTYQEKKDINNFLLELMTDIGNDGRLLKDVFYELVDKYQLKNTLLFQLYENEIIMMMGIDTYYSTKYMDLYLQLIKDNQIKIMELIKDKNINDTRIYLSFIFMIFHEYSYLNCNKPTHLHKKYNYTYYLLSSLIQETAFIRNPPSDYSFYKIHMKYTGDVIMYDKNECEISTIEVKNSKYGCKKIIKNDYIPRKILGKTNYKLTKCLYPIKHKYDNNKITFNTNDTSQLLKEIFVDFNFYNTMITSITNELDNYIVNKDYYDIRHLIITDETTTININGNDIQEKILTDKLEEEQYGINFIFKGWKNCEKTTTPHRPTGRGKR
jgi:hypothetical protein